jgi:hypothetical protein
VKYSGLRNQIAALRAQLPQRRLVIEITGGLPSNTATAGPNPPQQLELPLPRPAPRRQEARQRVHAPPGPILAPQTPTHQQPPLADPAPSWEQDWWRSRRQRRP